MLIEIHLLQNHAPSNLNRDDTGSPKECIFGGVRRARISSQCLKRSIRTSNVFRDTVAEHPLASRTRKMPEEVRNLLLGRGLDAELADAAALKAASFGGGSAAKVFRTKQLMFLTRQEIETVADVLEEHARTAKTVKKIEKLKVEELEAEVGQHVRSSMTIDVALFGRMTTSKAFRDIEASMQVAHAISTHRVDHEFDYFTAVDDLSHPDDDDEGRGAGMIGDVEFNSACYYKYFSVDIRAFAANLLDADPSDAAEADLSRARDVVQAAVTGVLRSAVFTTPSGKQNTFAAHQLPDVVLVEVRPVLTPISYANAFVRPARANASRDLIQASTDQLLDHVNRLTTRYSLPTSGRMWLQDAGNPAANELGGEVTACASIEDLISQLEETISVELAS